MQANTLWACDNFSKPTWTWRGPIDLCLLVFLHVGSRMVWISVPTAHPDSEWVTQQGRNFCMDVGDSAEHASIPLHDGDTKFTRHFQDVLKAEKIMPHQLSFVSPNLNAYLKRFIQTIQQECLDQFVVLIERHLDHLVREFVEYYHMERPHKGWGMGCLAGHRMLESVESPALSGLVGYG